MSRLQKLYILILLILIVDQWTKLYVKTHFLLGESVEVFSWFHIAFVENEGAAWGMKIPGVWGKLILSLFRIGLVGFIIYWINKQNKEKKPSLLIYSTGLILAGALGNIFDSMFYGLIFDDSAIKVATLFSDEPYGSFLFGKVVDMLSFPLINTTLPDWVPFWGGDNFRFFEYVFNISDASITIGAVGLFIFLQKEAKQKKSLKKKAL